MNVIAARLAERHPMNKGVGIEVIGLQANLVGNVRAGLYVMFAAVSCLLLVAALNLAGLLSARAAARSRELAVRLALGASRPRVVLQSMAEIAPVLLVGGALGVGVAAIAVRAFVPLAPANLPRVDSIAVDQVVLLVALVVLTVAGMLAAALPAAQAWGSDLTLASRDGSRGSTGAPRQARIRQALVVAQIALSLPLLTAAVLLTRSFTSVVSIDPGFRSENVVSLHLAIPRSKYRSDEHIARFEAAILERVGSTPGVQSAAIVNRLPLSGNRAERVRRIRRSPVRIRVVRRPRDLRGLLQDDGDSGDRGTNLRRAATKPRRRWWRSSTSGSRNSDGRERAPSASACAFRRAAMRARPHRGWKWWAWSAT